MNQPGGHRAPGPKDSQHPSGDLDSARTKFRRHHANQATGVHFTAQRVLGPPNQSADQRPTSASTSVFAATCPCPQPRWGSREEPSQTCLVKPRRSSPLLRGQAGSPQLPRVPVSPCPHACPAACKPTMSAGRCAEITRFPANAVLVFFLRKNYKVSQGWKGHLGDHSQNIITTMDGPGGS